MNEENKHIIYTAEDIKRYITGGMSPLEMHAIEMAALDDPLLAEAMEGYELMEQKDWSKELAALKKEFNKNKKDETPVVAMGKTNTTKWWRAAAAVLVLGISATTAYLFTIKNNKEPNPELATIKSARPEDSISVATNDSITPNFFNVTTDSGAPLIAKVDPGTKGSAYNYTTTTEANGVASATTNVPTPVADSSFIYKPSASSEYLAMKDDKTGGVALEKETRSEVAVVQPAAKNNATANSNNELNYFEGDFKNKAEESTSAKNINNAVDKYRANTFAGAVVTPDNKPVSFANINIPQVKKPIQTDANGRFYFTAADSVVKATVTSAGYSSQKITLQNSSFSNTIVMQPMDVAVNSIGKKRESKKAAVKWQETYEDTTDLDNEFAIPEGGWEEYNKYLNNNNHLTEVAKQKNVHGEVEVTVKINSNGEISQAKVTKPLSPECDAEAIRLVKEGPKFDLKKNKKSKVKVTVKF